MTLQDLFGGGATFTGQFLKLTWALAITHGFNGDLETIRPSQIFALLVAQSVATTSDKSSDPTYGAVIGRSYDSIVDRGDQSQIGIGYSLTLFVPNTTSTLDPDNVI